MPGMPRNTSSSASCPPGFPALSPLVLGTACCVFAALGYTIANLCLRYLTVDHDVAWVLCIKETVAVAVLGPWLAQQALRGRPSLPGGRTLLALAALGLLVQLGGNLPLIWSMGVIGLAVAVPISLGINLVGSAILGQILLGERVSLQSGSAILLLIVSVVFLTTGAGKANDAITITSQTATGPAWVALAVAAPCLAGMVFSVLNIAIRRTITRGVPLAAIAFLIPVMGTVALAPLSLGRHGLDGLLATPTPDFLLMLLCGLLNLLAYMAIIKGLQLTTIVHANVVSASQVAMAAVGGLLFFSEASSPSLMMGVVLTIAGMVMIDRPTPA